MDAESQNVQAAYKGIFITKRMKLLIPAGGISIGFDDNGEFTSSCTAHVGINLSPFWIEIACSHLKESEIAYGNLLDAGRLDDSEKIAEYLEKEFLSGMQAMMAAAIAVDAHYAVVKEYVSVSNDTLRAWRKNKTSRPRQIYEVFKQAFPTVQKSKGDIALFIESIFKFRDMAVHPKGDVNQPFLYPELQIGVEWRFLAFRFSNAKSAVRLATQIIALTLREPHPKKNAELKKFCIEFRPTFDEVITVWESNFGKLWEQGTSPTRPPVANARGESP